MRTPLVVCSVLEPTAGRTLERVSLVPPACGLVEIRCDHLTADEVAQVVRRSDRPVLVAVRRPVDGGGFTGSEEERGRSLLAALRAGAALVDVEGDSGLLSLVRGPARERLVLSRHGVPPTLEALRSAYRELADRHGGLLKLVARAGDPAPAGPVRELLEASSREGGRLACFAEGRSGMITRLLAPSWGSWATYGSPRAGREAAAGQLPVRDLLEVHRVLEVSGATRRFALLGGQVSASPSPAMHQAAYRRAGLDAVCLPIEADDLAACRPLLGPTGLAGIEALAVTMPFKEAAARSCSELDEISRVSGAVNTVRISGSHWSGSNTDGPAIAELVAKQLDPPAAEVAILGAGGTALAAAAALTRSGAHVTLYNRTEGRSSHAAARIGVEVRPLGDLARAAWDALVQATPLGAQGERIAELARLPGRLVVEVVYGASTPLLEDARRAGLRTVSGLELLAAQGVRQIEILTGVRPEPEELLETARRWLDGRSGAE